MTASPRRILVTGGASGLGRGIATAFRAAGDEVFIGDVDEGAAAAVAAEIGATALPLDIGDEASVQAAAGRIRESGGLDVLVNNAAYQHARGDGLETIDSENLDRVMKTNLYATIWASQEALQFLGRGSSIINTTSIQAYQPAPPLVDYAATKAALNNLTVNLAIELGERGIRVNAVAPGPIWTPLQPATQDPEKIEEFGGDTPLGRAGQAGECAGAYVFLASPSDASFVSGTVLGVTGGKPIF